MSSLPSRKNVSATCTAALAQQPRLKIGPWHVSLDTGSIDEMLAMYLIRDLAFLPNHATPPDRCWQHTSLIFERLTPFAELPIQTSCT